MTVVKTTIRNRRIDVPAPSNLPDGTEVLLTIGTDQDDGPMTPEEIERLRVAMRQLQPLDIPTDTAAELEEWERKTNQYSIDNADRGIDEVFR
jgi:hypothetical protein